MIKRVLKIIALAILATIVWIIYNPFSATHWLISKFFYFAMVIAKRVYPRNLWIFQFWYYTGRVICWLPGIISDKLGYIVMYLSSVVNQDIILVKEDTIRNKQTKSKKEK